MKQGRSERANKERTTGIYYKLLLLYFFVGKSKDVTKKIRAWRLPTGLKAFKGKSYALYVYYNR